MALSVGGSLQAGCHGRLSRSLARPAAAGRVGRRQLVVQAGRSGRGDRRKPPPPDLPSLLFDQRIVYLGMPVSVPTQHCRVPARLLRLHCGLMWSHI